MSAIKLLPYLQLLYTVPLAFLAGYIAYRLVLRTKPRAWAIVASSMLFIGSYLVLYSTINIVRDVFYMYTVTVYKITVQGNLYKPDNVLAYAHNANIKSTISTFGGLTFNVTTDAQGCRITEDDTLPASDSCLVYITGCSYSFGFACNAKDAYPYKLQQTTGCRIVNPSVSGYGLAQMLLNACRDIPALKPKYVVVQYSSWLMKRAAARYAPFFYGVLPTPYVANKGGALVIEPAAFPSGVFATPVKTFSHYPTATVGDKLKLIGAISAYWLPRAIPDYTRKIWLDIKTVLHLTQPVYNEHEIENFVYGELEKLCISYGAQLIVLNMSDKSFSALNHRVAALNHAWYAEADSALKANMGSNGNYEKLYAHWVVNGSDSMVVDVHPNAVAHGIMANEIVKLIQKH